MKKIKTYLRYLFEYLRHGDILSVWASIHYVLRGKSLPFDRIITTSIGKFYCRKNTNDFQFANYYYEWGVKRFLLKNKRSWSVFLNGGACIGDYCMLLAREDIRCIAFEPVPDNFKVLEKNLEINGLQEQVTAFPFGLGETESRVPFVFNPLNTGASHIRRDGESGDSEVLIKTLDSVIPELNLKVTDRILVMLDIEGMEADAIRGSGEFIRNFPNITFVLEDKHVGHKPIQEALSEIAVFEFGDVDEFNIFARKLRNHPA